MSFFFKLEGSNAILKVLLQLSHIILQERQLETITTLLICFNIIWARSSLPALCLNY